MCKSTSNLQWRGNVKVIRTRDYNFIRSFKYSISSDLIDTEMGKTQLELTQVGSGDGGEVPLLHVIWSQSFNFFFSFYRVVILFYF
jgi:hypothetical protein